MSDAQRWWQWLQAKWASIAPLAPDFLWPRMLWLLLILPLLMGLYIWLLRRQGRQALAYPQLALVREAMQGQRQWLRHAPALLLLLALACMLVGLARPVGKLALPTNQQTIVLTMDVSISMRATDVKPTRLQAAQAAAHTFVDDLPRDVKVGIVTFAGTAHVAQQPTTDRQALHQAIDGFQLQRATATGNAIVVSLGALFPNAGIELEQLGLGALRLEGMAREQPLPTQKPFAPQAPGSYPTAAVVMLSDGQRTVGIDAIDAARMAAERGVRVYTVGVGTVDGEVIGFDGWSMRVRLDEELLKAIAHTTDGQYFYAGNADDLQQVYKSLSSKLGVELQQVELSAVMAGIAAALTLMAVLWSLIRNRRIL